MPFLLALDQGTTSSRALIFDHDGSIRAVAQREHRQIYPQGGWVEHDAREIWSSQIGVAIEALGKAGLRPRDIASIGITNQRETTVVWNRETESRYTTPSYGRIGGRRACATASGAKDTRH